MNQAQLLTLAMVGVCFAGVAFYAYLGYRYERKRRRRISRLASKYFKQ